MLTDRQITLSGLRYSDKTGMIRGNNEHTTKQWNTISYL